MINYKRYIVAGNKELNTHGFRSLTTEEEAIVVARLKEVVRTFPNGLDLMSTLALATVASTFSVFLQADEAEWKKI